MSKNARIRKNDMVVKISGEQRGKVGRVLKVLVGENRVLVEKLNMVSRHTKPSAKNRQGGMVQKEAPIHVSNLALIDPKSGKPTRVGIKEKDGKKLRISKKSGKEESVIEIKR